MNGHSSNFRLEQEKLQPKAQWKNDVVREEAEEEESNDK